ncbi:MAG: Flp family type IVb pilin [Gemmatimonadota bacterium]|nr:Flp family type IVb pilin [Gemmatimonadota bacterium]
MTSSASPWRRLLHRFAQDCAGTTLLEYCLLAVLITALAIVAVSTLGGTVSTGFARADAGFP